LGSRFGRFGVGEVGEVVGGEGDFPFHDDDVCEAKR